MENPHPQVTPNEVSEPAAESWISFYDLMGLAAQKGFGLRHQTEGAAILEHSVNRMTIFITVYPDKQRGYALRLLRKYLS